MKKIFGLVFALILSLALFGCGTKVTSVTVDETSIPNGKEVGEFNITDIIINIEYSDGSKEALNLTEEMVVEGLDLLQKGGTHVIKAMYQKKEFTFSVTIADSVNAVIQAINDLSGNVTEADFEKIATVRALYDALSEENKAKITNYKRLNDIESVARVLKAKSLIDKIPSEITEADFELIEKAQEAYEQLVGSEINNVSTHLSKLETALLKMEEVKLAGGKDINFDINGGFWIGDYKNEFEVDANFTVKAYNSSAGATWGEKIVLATYGNPSAAGLYWDRIYFKYDKTIEEYVVVGKLTSGGKWEDEAPEYEYSIGYNTTNKESAEIQNAYKAAFSEIKVGDILSITGINLKTVKAGACTAKFAVYHVETLQANVVKHLDLSDKLPTVKGQQLMFTGWYTNPECDGEPVSKISSKYDTLYAGWEEKVKIETIEVTNKVDEILRYATLDLTWKISPSDASVQTVKFISSDEAILKISSKGVISALKEGKVTVKVVSTINANVYDEFEVDVYTPGRIEVLYKTSSVVEVGKTIHLEAEYAGRVEGTITWASDNEQVASVNNNGVVTGVKAGTATIIVKCDTVEVEIGITVVDSIASLDPAIQYLISTTQFNPLNFTAVSYGSPSASGPETSTNPYYNDILGSINLVLFEEFAPVEMIIPETNGNRPGLIKEKHYIVVHDTGTYTSALAYNFANNMHSASSDTSWHYTVGNDGVFHTVPDNESAYHAGDGSREYALENSGVKVTVPASEAVISINSQGNYTINGQDTNLRPYTDAAGTVKDTTNYDPSVINSQGIRCVEKDGYYYLGKTWFSKDYGYIGNFGGNRNGIGIESSVSLGTDYYYTWQKLAKLVANLMLQNDLTINDVKGHHFFSGKPCPQVILWNDSWDHFIELVKAEYEMITTFKDYKVTLSYDASDLMDSNGRLNRTNGSSNITYTITVTKNGVSNSITLSSMVPGLYTL